MKGEPGEHSIEPNDRCACVATDARDCMARRYGDDMLDDDERDDPREACDCACHEDDDEDGGIDQWEWHPVDGVVPADDDDIPF
jgi:hypothetical protein